MTATDFKKSVSEGNMPISLPLHLQALWYDGRGDWKTAHDLIDQLPGKDPALVHAYLHRKEGDKWNADYWYSRAGKEGPDVSSEKEWEQLLDFFLS